jgi:ABC-2 type transport system ATP-binding protein
VLLTTQYLDEADKLADRIAVIDHGRVIATGTRSPRCCTSGSELRDARGGQPRLACGRAAGCRPQDLALVRTPAAAAPA